MSNSYNYYLGKIKGKIKVNQKDSESSNTWHYQGENRWGHLGKKEIYERMIGEEGTKEVVVGLRLSYRNSSLRLLQPKVIGLDKGSVHLINKLRPK